MGFIGHTRFSLFNPDSPAWLASNGTRFQSAEEYRAYLYSEERLDVRCEIFLEMSLPQLELASRGENYRHVISYSDTLPAQYQDRLQRAEREFPFVVLDRHSSGGSTNPPMSVALQMFGSNSSGAGEETPFGLFRLDDDDLLSYDFFEQVRPYITVPNAGMQVSLGTGITALFDAGRVYNPRLCHSPMIAIGLLSVCVFREDGKLIRPLDASHNRSDRFNPVILDSRRISYLWLRHLTQDTSLRGSALDAEEALASTLRDLESFPRLQSIRDAEVVFPLSEERFSKAPSSNLRLISEISTAHVLDERGLRIDTHRSGQMIHVELSLECGVEAVAGNVLLGLSLVDPEGTPLGADVMKDQFRRLGLHHSLVPGIGHFRYLNVRPGEADLSVTFNLPEGVLCTSILVRRWNNPELNIRITRCDVFGLKEEDGPERDKPRIFIWGSCVSRDPFEMESNFEIVDYRARSSLGSAFAATPADWEDRVDIGLLSSPFQRRMVTSDVTKCLRADLEKAKFDALILDFVDDRMSTVDLNGSVVTDSPELSAAGFVASAETTHEPWTSRGWELRKAGIAALLEVVDPTRIIVNRVYWATTDDAGEMFVQARWIAKNNAFLQELYEIFEAVPGVRFINYPAEMVVAASAHRWGRQPYHYPDAVNAYFLKELTSILARSDDAV